MTPEELVPILRRPLAAMPGELELCPVPGPFEVTVRPPGSKSLTNRALLLAALAEGETVLGDCLLDADDAKVMIAALRVLGVGIEVHEISDVENRVRVRGVGGHLRGGCEINLNNAGTATRFLTAAVCLADAPVTIDGNARMRQRPIGELLELLRRLGVRVDELGAPGCVPIRVHPCRPVGGTLEVGTTQSSQFISAVMMIAPWTATGIEFIYKEPPTSGSYIEMTETLMSRQYEGYEPDSHRSSGGVLMPARDSVRMKGYRVEPDASAATYFFGAAAVVPRATAILWGTGLNSLQGDAVFPDYLRMFGTDGSICCDDDWIGGPDLLRGVDIDLSHMPDTAMTAAAVACFARGATTLRGMRTLRVKETDRLAALRNELTKIGVGVEIEGHEGAGGVRDELLRITPPEGGVDCSPAAARVVFDTYDDHRMAMSLAIIGLRRPNMVIRDPACVAKTYPGFWKDWARLYEGAPEGGHQCI